MRTAIASVLVVLLASLSCSRADSPQRAEEEGLKPENAEVPGEAVNALAEGNTSFAAALYAQLASEPGNLFFSPYSISAALAMTYAGAGSETAMQMADVLQFPAEGEPLHAAFAALDRKMKSPKGAELHVANALWGQKGAGFLKGFLATVKRHYGAGLSEVDFVSATEAARQTINAWVEKQTRDRIQDLIPAGALDPLTRLVLTNAIYFKGEWAFRFEKEATKDGEFRLADGGTVTVPFMQQKGTFGYLEGDGFQALALPYKGQDLSMVALLPAIPDGIEAFEERLTAENLRAWVAMMREHEVRVIFPRFKTTSQFTLNEALQEMGMTLPFSGQADFSGMNGERDLYISAVLHKAFVEVNEEGTEAAAATGVVLRLTALATPPPEFRADRPFVFLIRDNRTGSVLFLGRIMNPLE